jgi:hypothetical protein
MGNKIIEEWHKRCNEAGITAFAQQSEILAEVITEFESQTEKRLRAIEAYLLRKEAHIE